MSNLFRKITLFAAGVDYATISKCSSAEQGKYSTLGTLVYIPLVTGVVAMAFASSYFTHNPLIMALACMVWAVLVFVIERALISGLRPHRWSWAIPVRFILAIAMSCIITELLMIFFFRADISDRIAEKQAIQVEQTYATWNARVEDLKAELDRQKQILDEKERIYTGEVAGSSGTFTYGDGPAAKAKKSALDRELVHYSDSKRRLEREIDAAVRQRDEKVASVVAGNDTGILKSMISLYELSSTERQVAIALLVVHIFFLCVELMPLFVKISYPGTQYYDILDMADSQTVEAQRLTMEDAKRLVLLKGQCENTQKEMELQDEMTRMQYRHSAEDFLMKARAMSETAVAFDAIDIKNNKQLSESRAEILKEQLTQLFGKYISSLGEMDAVCQLPLERTVL